MSNPNVVWGRRLKEARLRTGLSQRELGIRAGLDAFVASTRINRYEVGVHKADYLIAQRLADIVSVPVAYFYCDDEALADILLHYNHLSLEQKNNILKMVMAFANTESDSLT
jgi:transcriptional regulator with XRE-family HTH domain